MQKNKDTASRGSRSPVKAIVAALLAFALSFMAFDANTLRAAFADENAQTESVEVQQDETQTDDTATVPESGEQPIDQEQPADEASGEQEVEGDEPTAAARDGPADEPTSDVDAACDDGQPSGTQDAADEGVASKTADEEGQAEPKAKSETRSHAVTAVVTFYSDSESSNPSILARKKATAQSGATAVVDVSDVSAPARTAAEVFDGWLYNGIVARDEIALDPAQGDVALYPSFASGHWLRFSTGIASGEATETGSQFVEANGPVPTTLPTSTRAGYSFDGWFEGAWDGGSVAFGAQVADATGAVSDPDGLKARLASSDVQLFAKWTGQPTTYRIVSWHENADDDAYSYAGFELVGDEDGEHAVSGEMTDVSDLPAVEGFTAKSVDQATIAGDGSTVVNAYYDRNEYSIYFHRSTSSNSAIFEDLTITAKYGADVHDEWPDPLEGGGAYTVSWYTVPDKADDTFVNGINTMPLGGAHFYLKTDKGMNFKTVFMVQDIGGGNSFSTYVVQRFSARTAPGTTADDYMAIKGFMVNAASEEDARLIRLNAVGDKAATHDGTFLTSTPVGKRYDDMPIETEEGDVDRYTSRFYYLRCVYDIVFEENGGPAIADVEDVYYQEALAGSQPSDYMVGETTFERAGVTYVFEGWYDNAEFFGEPFDFSTEAMPAGNVALYAKWAPKSYVVRADPAGGAFDDPAQPTRFTVKHGDAVGALGVSRDYVADEDGDYLYAFDAGSDDAQASGEARYVLAQPGEAGKRYSYSPGTYTLFGWFEQDGGMLSSTPFDFSEALTRDVSIIARWRSEGVFDIAYNPVMRVGGTTVSGDIERRLDDGYADLSSTFVMNEPVDITSSDGKAYRFVGWTLVEGFEEGDGLLVDGIYAEGDPFVVDSEFARDNVIHFQAVYEEVPESEVPGANPAPPDEPGADTGTGSGTDPGAGTGTETGTPDVPDAETPVLTPEASSDGVDVDDGDGEDAAQGEDGDANSSATAASEGGDATLRVMSSEGGAFPKTDDAMMTIAVAIGGIALIALGVALTARAMRKRHDELVADNE